MSADANKEKVVEEILRMQQKRTDVIMARDGAAMDKLFDEDYHHVHSSGSVNDKATYIDRLVTGKSTYKSFVYNNVKVRVYGDCAIATGDVLIDSTNSLLDLRYTNVWVKRDGSWRSASWQSASNSRGVSSKMSATPALTKVKR